MVNGTAIEYWSLTDNGNIYSEYDRLKEYIDSMAKVHHTLPLLYCAFLKMCDFRNEETYVRLVQCCCTEGEKTVRPVIVIGIEDVSNWVDDHIIWTLGVNRRFLDDRSRLWPDSVWHHYVALNNDFVNNLKETFRNVANFHERHFYNYPENYRIYADTRLTLWEQQNREMTEEKLQKIYGKGQNSSGNLLLRLLEMGKDCVGNKSDYKKLSKKLSDKKNSLLISSHHGQAHSITREQYIFNAIREAVMASKSEVNWDNTLSNVLLIDDEIGSTNSEAIKNAVEELDKVFHFSANAHLLFGIPKCDTIKSILDEDCLVYKCETNSNEANSEEENKKSQDIEVEWRLHKCEENRKEWLGKFNHIFVDLWDGKAMGGFETIRTLKAYFAEEAFHTKDSNLQMPVIMAISQSDDPETIRLAFESGADGFISKREIGNGSAPLSMVRAGIPLNANMYVDFSRQVRDNFPSINRLPRLLQQKLFYRKVEVKASKASNNINYSWSDRQWLRSLPKTDLHVHFGMALHPYWCYTLSLISLRKFCDVDGELAEKSEEIFCRLKSIFDNDCLKNTDADSFRSNLLSAFAHVFNDSSISDINSAMEALGRCVNGVPKDFVVCVFNVYLCLIKYKEENVKNWLNVAANILRNFKIAFELNSGGALPNDDKDKEERYSGKLQNPIIHRDVAIIIKNINFDSISGIIKEGKLKLSQEVEIGIAGDYFPEVTWSFDPFSAIVAVGVLTEESKKGVGFGLPKYIGAANLTGGTLLQFPETIILASIAIPRWCNPPAINDIIKDSKEAGVNLPESGQKGYFPGTLEDFFSDARYGAYRDNIVHLELRTTPSGFLNPFVKKNRVNMALATRLILCGLEFGCRFPADSSEARRVPKITANLLISVKRDRDVNEVEALVALAVDLMKEFRKYAGKEENELLSDYVPHVSGLDVAGIERGNLPDKLKNQYKEAFEYSLISTVHAGETEDPKSIWQAIHYLGAKRLGHALTLKNDEVLLDFVRDTGLPIELCPRSNQFVHGYSLDDDAKYPYVFHEYSKSNLRMSINTDDPIISHRLSSHDHFVYPLSEEFLWLAAAAIPKDKSGNPIHKGLTRLKVLQLIHIGMNSMFCSPRSKLSRLVRMDRQIYSRLMNNYLDFSNMPYLY